MRERCVVCGCYLKTEDNSYLGQGGWVENEVVYCNNPKCDLNNTPKRPKRGNHER